MDRAARREAFSTMLRFHRFVAGLTQEALAEQAGVSARAIMYLERGDRMPHPSTLGHLSVALQLTSEERAEFAASALQHTHV